MRPRTAVITWGVAALLLTASAVVDEATRSGLDDPNPARQRSQALLPALKGSTAAPVSEDVLAPRRRAVVLFLRWEQYEVALRVLGPGTLPPDVDLGLVLPGRPPFFLVPAKAVAYDAAGDLARAYGMPLPLDGGLAVGYALVDSRTVARAASCLGGDDHRPLTGVEDDSCSWRGPAGARPGGHGPGTTDCRVEAWQMGEGWVPNVRFHVIAWLPLLFIAVLARRASTSRR